MWHWLSHHLGMDNASGGYYLFWSGFGSDITEFALVGGLVGVARAHNCHVKGCWRIGKHPHGLYKLCSRHHPEVPDRGPDRVSAALLAAHGSKEMP